MSLVYKAADWFDNSPFWETTLSRSASLRRDDNAGEGTGPSSSNKISDQPNEDADQPSEDADQPVEKADAGSRDEPNNPTTGTDVVDTDCDGKKLQETTVDTAVEISHTTPDKVSDTPKAAVGEETLRQRLRCCSIL